MCSEPGDVAVEVEGLGKCFRLFDRPQDRLIQGLSRRRKRYREFWALRDVSFTARRGETLGIIGQNGSGKSTLLQMIAGTLTPTTGSVRVSGRVTALLELGSGFDPDFTGRENVFINGGIFGFSRAELRERLDEIVAFADIGPFLDQPVRTYSTGMVVRLAFAIQACLPKELLIVDEVLAVGDEAFQRRCFAKIEEFQENGGTVLLVSHGAGSVVQLCDRAILLDRGELVLEGSSKLVVELYQRFLHAPADARERQREELRALNRDPDWERHLPRPAPPPPGTVVATAPESRPGPDAGYDAGLAAPSGVRYESRGARIESAWLSTPDGTRVNLLRRRGRYVWRYSVVFEEARTNVRFGMLIKTVSGLELGGAASAAARRGLTRVEAGARVDVAFSFSANLAPGTYFLNAGVLAELDGGESFLDRWLDVQAFKILPDRDSRVTCWVDFEAECSLSLASAPAPTGEEARSGSAASS